MSVADHLIAKLKTMESYESIGLAKATALCMLGVAIPHHLVSEKVNKIEYSFDMISGACSQVSKVTTPALKVAYIPKTSLGKKLFAIRQKAKEQGVTLLTEEQIIEEVMRRRGDLADVEV